METNVFFSAVQSAIDAHIERMVDARLKEILTTNKAYEMIMSNLSDRVTALENNPAIGVDTTLAERVTALEERMDNTTGAASDERIREIAEAAAEQAVDNHCENYNHDDYDSVVSNWNDEDPADFLREGDLHDQIDDRVNNMLRNATFSISI